MIQGKFIPINFLGLDEENSRFDTSKVVILPVPFERTVSFGRGTSRGPYSIIYASRCLELYDDELGWEPSTVGIHTLPELECGSVDPADNVSAVGNACSQLLQSNKFVITLGGEHSITPGAVKGHKAQFDNFSLLNLDAHCDLRNSYEETPFNHACAMRRVLDEGCPVVEVGIRSYSKEEAEFIKGNKKVKVFHAREIAERKNREWMDDVTSNLLPRVYISVDVDVFDPSIVPGTGTPEPGGLGWYEVIHLIKKVFKNRDVIGFDIMELSPILGITGPEVLAARLAYKAIGYKFNPQL